MKNYVFPYSGKNKIPIPCISQLYRIMKLTSLLLIIAAVHVSAVTRSQVISLSIKNQPLGEVFREIVNLTGITAVYNERYVNPNTRVSITVEDVQLSEALNVLLTPLSLRYHITESTIVVMPMAKKTGPDRDPNQLKIQNLVITGRITDEEGLPIDAVTISLKGTTVAVTSNANGDYRIQVPDEKSILVFTMIGFEPVESIIGNRSAVNVSLVPSISDLDEVVIIGYGTQQKSDVTAAVSSVPIQAFSNRTVLSLSDALKGQAAGLYITQNDGTPGSESTIRIRGTSSISAASTPLFVIDGVLEDNADNISPGEIQSVEILKDASGTAIYGARGANGVILITTKRGIAGKPKVELYSNTSFQFSGKLYDMMSSPQYARARYLASGYTYSRADPTNPDMPASPLPQYTYYRDSPLGVAGGFWGRNESSSYANWQNFNHPDSVNTDWQGAMLQNSMIQENRVNFSGGTKETLYSFMGGYFNQDGLIIQSNYRRYNGRFNFRQTFSKAFQLALNVSGNSTVNDGFISGTSSGVITSMLNKSPIEALTVDDREEDVDGFVSNNPFLLANNMTNLRSSTHWTSRAELDWKISRKLTFKVTGNLSSVGNETEVYYPSYTQAGTRARGRAIGRRGKTTKLMNENLLYYKTDLGRQHRLNALGGFTVESYRNSQIEAENQNFDIELLGAPGMSNGVFPIVPTYDITDWRMASFFGRAEYSYAGKYLATITMRSDGSSRFGSQHRWGHFPSAALGWNLYEEDFIKNIPAISEMKLRTSIGQSGNTAIPAYRSLSTIATRFSPMDGVTPNFGVIIERPANRSLKWESTTQSNIGLDVGLFQAVNISAEWYNRVTQDMLVEKVVPGYSGYRRILSNLGSIKNRGFEFTVNSHMFDRRPFNWEIDVNIGINRSHVIDVGPDIFLDPNVINGLGSSVIIQNGSPIGQWFGYQTDGIWQSIDEINASGLTQIHGRPLSAIRPGSRKFVDQDGNGIINTEDRVVLGEGQPLFSGGFTNRFRYKGFEFSVLMQFNHGNDVYNANRVLLEAGRGISNMTEALSDAWRPSLYDLTTGQLVEEGNPANKYRMPGSEEELLMLSDWLEDGSFVRLSDVTLAYNLGFNPHNKLGIRGVGLFLSGKNLLLFSNYSGYDPEVNTRQGGFGDLVPSLDYSAYPRFRSVSLGVKLNF